MKLLKYWWVGLVLLGAYLWWHRKPQVTYGVPLLLCKEGTPPVDFNYPAWEQGFKNKLERIEET